MIIYIVFGIEWHVCREVLGLYDTPERAEIRKKELDAIPSWESGFNAIEIEEHELNKDIPS